MFGAVLNRLATSVRRALSKYAVGTQEPELAFDFIDNEYITNNSTSNFASAITHARSGNAVMTDGYGPELVTNGGFDSGTDGWSVAGTSCTLSYDNGKAQTVCTGTDGNSRIGRSVGILTAGTAYIFTLQYYEASSYGFIRVTSGSITGSSIQQEVNTTNNGNRRVTMVFVPSTTQEYFVVAGGNFTAGSVSTFDNVSVREMPVLKWAPHNLLSYSEDLTNGGYNKAGASATADQATAPDGTATADLLTSSDTTAQHQVQAPTVSFVSGQKYTNTWFVKSGTHDYVQVLFFTAAFGSNAYANFDLSTGATGTVGSAATASITDVGNDWYRLEVTADATTTATSRTSLNFITSSTASRNESWDADGTETIYVWGAHLYRSDLGGMVDNPERGDSYVPTALRPTGANLVTNGTFDTDTTGWTGVNGAALSVSNGALVVTSNGTAIRPQANQTITGLTVGKAYELTALAKSGVNNFPVEIEIAGISGVYEHSSTSFQRITRSFVATSTSHVIQAKFESGSIPTAGSTVEFDNISVRESTVRPDTARYLPRIGHHVYNGSAWVNEGLLAESEARTNLIERSNTFDSGWSATGLSGRAANEVGPDGVANSAYTLTTSTATAIHANGNMTLFTSGSDHTGSCYLKKGTQRYVKLRAGNTTTWPANVIFDLDNGIVDTEILGTGTIQEVGNGWYRCSVTATAGATANTNFNIYILNDSKAESYTGTGAETAIVWGAQVEIGTTPSSFIPSDDGTSTITRAAETFTIPSANLPWPSPSYIGSELVTNGTFDTDSDWTKGTNATISGGTLSYAGGSGNGDTYQNVGLVVGKVYWGVFTVSNRTAGSVKLRQGGVSSGGTVGASADGTYSSAFVVPSGANANLLVDVSADFVGDIDNISVREINPLSVSIAMDGRVTYADEDTYSTVILYSWYKDSNNYLLQRIDTALTQIGHQVVHHRANGVDDYSTGNPSNTMFSPDVLVPFDVAARHGSTFVQAASDGLTPTANTTPTALPDLSVTNLSLANDYMGTIGTFRVWDKDLGDTGLVEATNPSLEPSLSLTFGTGTNSFVVNDWSE